MAFTRPEYTFSTSAWLLLFLAWLLFPSQHLLVRLLLGWSAISLAGAILTVLPLPFLPFRPEQSLSQLRSSRFLCGNAATGSLVDVEDVLREVGCARA